MLQPDDLNVGEHITVLNWKRKIEVPDFDSIFGGMGIGTISTKSKEDQSYKGDVLEITSVDLPFIVVTVKKGLTAFLKRPLVLDTREVELKRLSEEFVKAALEKY
jgi:hypothetical protein